MCAAHAQATFSAKSVQHTWKALSRACVPLKRKLGGKSVSDVLMVQQAPDTTLSTTKPSMHQVPPFKTWQLYSGILSSSVYVCQPDMLWQLLTSAFQLYAAETRGPKGLKAFIKSAIASGQGATMTGKLRLDCVTAGAIAGSAIKVKARRTFFNEFILNIIDASVVLHYPPITSCVKSASKRESTGRKSTRIIARSS